MKTHAYAGCAALLVCAGAHAQSSVTMYGIVDEFVQYVNTGKGYTAAMGSSGEWASRFGLKGSEEIGSGLKVNFQLENGFNPNDGSMASPSQMFNRQAWIGISGNWGEFRMGRQNSPVFYDQGYLDAFGASTQASGFSNLMTYVVRTSNTISYQSPVVAGLQAGLYVGFGTEGGLRSGGSSYQADLQYNQGPIAAAVAWQAVRNRASNSTDTAIEAGASYQIGKATIFAGWNASRWTDIGLNVRVYGISGKYQITPASMAALGVAMLRDQTAANNHARQISAMYQYDLSKRTSLYATISYLDNRNEASYTLAGSANPGLPLAYPGAPARGISLGMFHKF
ncbi:porin [Burkholderia stagnalis]|uniref:porin n=1 Tax=Burkholderia stagnalis TaxID=1503054 RepID=UPI000F561AD3|nr:porin [Burkholderia stagnalis]RQQ45038.1 porin [Burkholderia stagnalis]RQX94012.1 porin [Burkholderia stagnalis]RQY20349.1 porin [Burkholderia stagnalis]RQY31558.1 porin [Burkholderia stagnalis]